MWKSPAWQCLPPEVTHQWTSRTPRPHQSVHCHHQGQMRGGCGRLRTHQASGSVTWVHTDNSYTDTKELTFARYTCIRCMQSADVKIWPKTTQIHWSLECTTMRLVYHYRCWPVSREIREHKLIVDESWYSVGGDGADGRGRDDITTLKQVRMITHLRGNKKKKKVRHYLQICIAILVYVHTHTFLNCMTRLRRCEVAESFDDVCEAEDCRRSSTEMRWRRPW